jgi:Major Facilitator Superfamily
MRATLLSILEQKARQLVHQPMATTIAVMCLSSRRKLLVLGICCMSLFIVSMDTTIINVALPSISKDLGAPISGLQWTIDAYVVVLASFLLLSGSIADRVGRRRTFQTGLAIFVCGSVLCSLGPSVGWLVAFRMVQALGGSMLNPVAMSIITNVFTEPRERARAIGIWGGVSGIGIGLGPLVGGILVEFVDWRAIFWINLPIGVVALTAAGLFVPDSRSPHPRRFDPLGQLAMVVLLASCIYAIIEAPRRRLGVGANAFAVRPRCCCADGPADSRTAANRPADRTALLPQRAVLRRHADRDQCVRRIRWLSLHEYALSANDSRAVPDAGRSVHGATRTNGADLFAGLRACRR